LLHLEGDEDEDKEEASAEKKGKYAKFWKEFGKAIKLGIIEDATNRVRLAKLLRFHSSKSGDSLTSLDQYISRMKPGQKQIYYITGQDRKQLEKSPFLEKLLNKGYEVWVFFLAQRICTHNFFFPGNLHIGT
jgi:heat shock protein beta